MNQPGRAWCLSRGRFTSSRTTFAKSPRRSTTGCRPGKEVRLRAAYIIKCEKVVKDAAGNITEIHCTYDPETKSGGPAANRKVKGTVHWVSARHAVDAEVRLYDRLFVKEDPNQAESGDFPRPT